MTLHTPDPHAAGALVAALAVLLAVLAAMGPDVLARRVRRVRSMRDAVEVVVEALTPAGPGPAY